MSPSIARRGKSSVKSAPRSNKKNGSFAHSTPKPSRKDMEKKAAAKPVYKKTVLDSSTLAPGLERLERAIAHMGLASRREAKELISKGLVKVNKKIVTNPGHGIKVGKDAVEIEGAALSDKAAFLVYKPRGIETSKTNDTSKDLHDYFPKFKHLAPIGRLDKESEGLIIMSNDGTLARALTEENSHVSKTYEVEVREHVTEDAVQKMRKGIMLDKVRTKPATVERTSRTTFTIVLHEGRKHQIRRMCDACHLTVESLIRTDIGHLTIGDMRPGSSRKLIQDDVEKLKG